MIINLGGPLDRSGKLKPMGRY